MGQGASSLHDAAAKDHAGAVRTLLEDEHVDPNLQDKDGWRPLHFAAYGGSEKATAELISHGADVRATDQGGRTPLHLAALQGKTGVMKQLLDARAPSNISDENGMTPLHKAAVGGREAACKILLDAGASLDSRLKDGSTPLHLATWKGHFDVVKLLVLHGASPTAARYDGLTPLHEAAETGNARLVHAYLALGADKNARNQDGTTPADSAAKAGYTDLASLISGYTSPRSGRYVPNKEAAFQDAAEAAPPTQASGPQLHPRVAAAFAQQKQQVSPAAPAYHDNPPTAPPVPAKGGPSFSPKTPDPPGGHVNYPQLYSPSTQHDARHASPTRQRVSDPDWWSSNIGRDVKGFKDSNAGAVGGEGEKQQQQQQPGVRPRDQFERAVQQKVGSLFGGIAGAFGGGNQQKRAQTPQPQDEDWAGGSTDEWGASGKSEKVPRQEKYDLEPYDSDDYTQDISPRKSQAGERQESAHSVARRMAELELSVDRTQGWVRGGSKEDARGMARQKELLTQQERELAHLRAQLASMQAANKDIDASKSSGHVRSTDQGIPTEYICPITQEVFEDPVIAADGYTYERAPMLTWLQTGHTVSPMTNEQLAHPGLTPNHALRSAVRQWQGR